MSYNANRWTDRATASRLTAVVAVAILAMVLAGAAPAQPTALKIGVFDAQRISEETVEGRRVQTQLEAFRDRKQAELTAAETELGNLQSQLEAQALSLSNERRLALEKEIQRKALSLQQIRDTAAREMQLEVGEAQDLFQSQLVAVIDSFGQAEGFDLILEIGTVVYASKTIDVTTAIVDRFNEVVKPPAEQAGTPEGN